MKLRACFLAGVLALILCACGANKKEPNDFNIDDNGKEFLHSMCYYMPDWTGPDALDDQFWDAFLFASFTGAGMTEDGKAETICGEAEYVTVYREDLGFEEGQIKVSKEAVAQYVELALGRELPEFEPAFSEMRPRQTARYYEDGYYYIGVSDFGSVQYVFKECETQEDAEGTYALVSYDIMYDGLEGEAMGVITFTLRPAENENGFIITGRETKQI